MPEPTAPESQADQPTSEPGVAPKRTGRWGSIVTVALVIVALLAGVWALQRSFGGGAAETAPGSSAPVADGALVVGSKAPDFTGKLLDGSELSLSKLSGKPVWLVFGATWCPNCRAEAPDVQEISKEFAGRASVVSVYVGEDVATVQGYAERASLAYPQLPDPAQQIASSYQVTGYPKHFFIDSAGVIKKIRVGVVSPADARAELSALES